MINRLLFIGCMILAGCSHEIEQPTYRPYSSLFKQQDDIRLHLLKQKFDSLSKPVLAGTKIEGTWTFRAGDLSEVLQASIVNVIQNEVSLPHRSNVPDRAYWYSREVIITEPGVLSIQADDGAQFFIGEKQVKRLKGIYFPVDTIGALRFTIRVLNNAMSGGLRHVQFSSYREFSDYENSIIRYERTKQLVERALLKQNPSTELINSVKTVLNNPNDESVSLAENEWTNFPFFAGPWLQVIDKKTYSISLQTANKNPVVIRYGESADDLDKQQQASGTLISFLLPDLKQGTKYFYQLTSAETFSPIYSFDTEKHSAAFSFIVWADSQSGWDAFQQNISNTYQYNDAFGIGVGDLVSNGADAEHWRMFFNILSESASGRPYYLIAGNHDYDGYYDDLQPILYNNFTKHNPPQYFSWTYGNAAFIALDPNENFPIGIKPSSAQHTWLMGQLQSPEWQHATWRFVLLHQPPYSQGWKDYHGDIVIRELLEPLIEAAKIDFVVSGHTHDYERMTKMYGQQKTTFLIVGGGGGSLETDGLSDEPKMDTVINVHHFGRFYVDDRTLRFEAIGLNKKLIDSFQHTK